MHRVWRGFLTETCKPERSGSPRSGGHPAARLACPGSLSGPGEPGRTRCQPREPNQPPAPSRRLPELPGRAGGARFEKGGRTRRQHRSSARGRRPRRLRGAARRRPSDPGDPPPPRGSPVRTSCGGGRTARSREAPAPRRSFVRRPPGTAAAPGPAAEPRAPGTGTSAAWHPLTALQSPSPPPGGSELTLPSLPSPGRWRRAAPRPAPPPPPRGQPPPTAPAARRPPPLSRHTPQGPAQKPMGGRAHPLGSQWRPRRGGGRRW
ncbi:proline-rich protein 2-like [Gavia stellata]|uniref:proline-rich protein 2-like n=1 Tax=Gavia stellata TaxID=37040 RepID=UPI0028A113A3|nr:proline-rich protein 2-like [Gavia stellata]